MDMKLNVLGIVYYVTFLSAILLGIVAICRLIFKLATKNAPKTPNKFFIIMPFVILFISAAAFILNMGWIRVALVFSLIGPAQAVFFLFSSFYSSAFATRSRTILTFTIINYIAYPAIYLLLPDGGDIGGAYMFFALIKSDMALEIGSLLAPLFFIVSLVSGIVQTVTSHKLKKAE